MSVESHITTLGLPREVEPLAWQTRARITWGDAPSEVERWQLGNGVSERMAQEIMDVCVRERARSMRVKGLRDLLIGVTVVAVCAGIPAAIFLAGMHPLRFFIAAKGIAIVCVLCILGLLYGMHLMLRAGERLLMGAGTKGTDSDVDDLSPLT